MLEPAARLEDRLLFGRAPEVRCELGNSSAVAGLRGDVRPLVWIAALREEPAELVQARRVTGENPVRVLIDERDSVQYFKKWPWCSNSSSSPE